MRGRTGCKKNQKSRKSRKKAFPRMRVFLSDFRFKSLIAYLKGPFVNVHKVVRLHRCTSGPTNLKRARWGIWCRARSRLPSVCVWRQPTSLPRQGGCYGRANVPRMLCGGGGRHLDCPSFHLRVLGHHSKLGYQTAPKLNYYAFLGLRKGDF